MHLRQARVEARKMNVPKRAKIIFELLDQNENAQLCEWIDPDKGTFKINGQNGFSHVDDFNINNPFIRNMRVIGGA